MIERLFIEGELVQFFYPGIPDVIHSGRIRGVALPALPIVGRTLYVEPVYMTPDDFLVPYVSVYECCILEKRQVLGN